MPDSLHALRLIAQKPWRAVPIAQRYRPNPGRHEADGDLILSAYGYPGLVFNEVMVFGPMTPEQVFARANAFFGATAYAVVVDAETAKPTEEALRAAGWRLDEEEPALVLTSIPTPPPAPPPGMTIEVVTTESGLNDFLSVSGKLRHWVPTLAFVRDPAVAFFVGYVDGVPVATSRLVCYEDVGDITGVLTLPAYRRRGIGAAMTWAACAEGERRGCTAMTLTASAMGEPVYRAMGFTQACMVRTYLPPETAHA